MEKSIFLTDVLKQMDFKNPEGFAVPFDIELREFSVQNHTGGKYKFYNNARLLVAKPKRKTTSKNINQKLLEPERQIKNPNHFENHTRNIELANGEIKKINILFIVKFNGKKVIY